MLPLAAAAAGATTAFDRLKGVPFHVWWKLAAAVAALILVVVLLRKVAQTNKVILGVAVAVALTIISFNWIYQRTEPAWATPAVEFLAGFFPSKGRS